MRCVKYGVTRDYVLGLKAIWQTVPLFNGASPKFVSGLNLRVVIGSEGTLGIVTKAHLSFAAARKALDGNVRI